MILLLNAFIVKPVEHNNALNNVKKSYSKSNNMQSIMHACVSINKELHVFFVWPYKIQGIPFNVITSSLHSKMICKIAQYNNNETEWIIKS